MKGGGEMRKQIIILSLIAIMIVSIDPSAGLLIASLVLTILLLSLGGDNE